MSKSLLRSSFVFSFVTFISRIFGFIRDMAAAYVFGVSPAYDAFIVAFRIPNLMRRLFAEGAFSQAFVPVISEYRVEKNRDEIRYFLACVSGSLGVSVLLISLIGVLASGLIIKTMAAGFSSDGERAVLATEMLRITFPYLIFITYTALGGCILNAYGSFAASAAAPIVLNMALISGSVFFATSFFVPEMVLPYAVVVGGILQCVIIMYAQYKAGLHVWPKLNWSHPAVKKVIKLMIPAMYGAAAGQINLLIDSVFASFLAVGSISWLYYADRLMEFPLGIFGVSFSTVILPKLSREFTKKQHDSYTKTIDWGVRWILLVAIPCAIGIFVLAGPIITTLFYTGKFKQTDVMMSQLSLKAYALAIIGIMLCKVFASAFYARKEIWVPVRISTICIAVNIILNAIFIKYWAHVGLALATSIASLVNAAMLLFSLQKNNYYKMNYKSFFFLMRIVLASSTMLMLLYFFTPDVELWFSYTVATRIKTLTILVCSSVVTYSVVLYISGVRFNDLLITSERTFDKVE